MPDLLDRLRTLPCASPLLDAVGELPGVHLVGGAVRDLLLGRTPRELDLAVEGDIEPVLAAIGAVENAGGPASGGPYDPPPASSPGRRSHRENVGGPASGGPYDPSPASSAGRRSHPYTHDRFGTATVVAAGCRYDVAMTRSERYERPGALPDVRPAGLVEDLRRRDVTVNAMALRLSDGALQAVPHALEDLDARLLRVLHDRSFLDDPTRLWRIARYRARLGFAIEAHTRELAVEAVAAGALQTVSGTRIGNELRLALRE